MTIITKPISEKKAEKLSVPLVENDQLASAVSFLFLLICNGCGAAGRTFRAEIVMIVLINLLGELDTKETLV